MPAPSTYTLNLPPRKPASELEPPRNKFYSPEVYDLADLLAIPINAARRVLAAQEV